MKNEMYDYLKDHNYISENKKWNRQSELSEDRAECIANKYHSLTKEMQQENQELKKQLEAKETQQKEFIEWLENKTNDTHYRVIEFMSYQLVLQKYKEITEDDSNE